MSMLFYLLLAFCAVIFTALMWSLSRLFAMQQNLMKSSESFQSQFLNSPQRGLMGEKMLENFLNYLGLKEGMHFTRQTQTEQGRPDIALTLPSGQALAIDAKFPQIADPRELKGNLKKHLGELKKRKYHLAQGFIGPTFLLLPSENTFQHLLQHQLNLYFEALDDDILICSPGSLLPLLVTMHDLADKNAQTHSTETLIKEIQRYKDDQKTKRRELIKILEGLKRQQKSIEQLISQSDPSHLSL